MRQRQCLAAVTECTGYAQFPAYVSINLEWDGDQGSTAVRVTVRGRDRTDCSEIVLSPGEFEQLREQLNRVR